jgi:hypothetical protein
VSGNVSACPGLNPLKAALDDAPLAYLTTATPLKVFALRFTTEIVPVLPAAELNVAL